MYVNISLPFYPTVGPRFIINPIASQEVVINGTLILSCSAEGFPIPSIIWFMNNTMIDDGLTDVSESININSSTLMISNADLNDSGMYYCQAVSSEFPELNITSTVAIIAVVGKFINIIKQVIISVGNTVVLVVKVSWMLVAANNEVKTYHKEARTSPFLSIARNPINMNICVYVCKIINVKGEQELSQSIKHFGCMHYA